ncbi:sensor histidine kinase [Allonocardiopsis opalescens]|uniref:histidine kinase n=1 Tax=Allonocardiopsis opalescens TaxID=1144618 RepID=A0A2T0Q2P9_9ACTN|nr:ATP-binding protein [Allonocardiopsis opalescens]PRX98073.1 two-component system sensor histidine kinase BaeS [Allonocardiopsis opalescens]
MRRSLLLRLLGLSLAVASLAVAATALLATYGTGTQLREQAESSPSLLETDASIRDALLTYARDHGDWSGVHGLVRELAAETGRRIALTTPDGSTIADSAELLGQGAAELPSVPAARIDAADPGAQVAQIHSEFARAIDPQLILAHRGWRLTEQEQRHRQELAEQALECLREQDGGGGPDPSGQGPVEYDPADGSIVVTYNWLFGSAGGGGDPGPHASECVPPEMYAPSAAARELNEETVALTAACLDREGIAYRLAADAAGVQAVEPVDGSDQAPRWAECESSAQRAALRPLVAEPADLYLGTSDRFDAFSPQGWWRTAATALAVLAAAAVVTVLAGRRLVRPILALTEAAQRMAAGDRAARVPVTGGDEVTRLGTAFNAMAESIESSDRQRKALVSDVAHELRTPLANVRSHLEAAEDGVVPLDRALIASLLEESALLERLVADLQDLALADAGMLRVHPEERDAADLAAQAVAAHRARAEESGVTVAVDAPEPVPVHADPARLRQALGNLVSNAVRHTPSGGTVRVSARRTADGAVLTVADSGSGIGAEHLPHIFDRFYRADPSRTRATGGGGLGLAITRHLVEAHHGRVEVASTPGSGSVFTIHLPDARHLDGRPD